MANVDKSVPRNVEAEEAVLGAMLIDPESAFRVRSFLRGEDFYLKKNQWVYDALVAIFERREPVDFLTVTTELEKRGQIGQVGGAAYIAQLMSAVPSAMNIAAYGHLVEEAAVRRRLLDSVSDIARFAYQEEMAIEAVLDHAESALFGVSERRLTRELQPVQEAAQRYYDRIEYLYEHRGEPLGVPSGFRDIDRLLGGFQRSDFIIMAARPSVGKTSLCLSMARNAARYGKHIAIFSLEMSAEQIVQRIVAPRQASTRNGCAWEDPRTGGMAAVHRGRSQDPDLPIYIDDTPRSP